MLFSDISLKELRKFILFACGGNFTSAYFQLMEMDVLYLVEELKIFEELQQERLETERKAMQKNTPKGETMMEGNYG